MSNPLSSPPDAMTRVMVIAVRDESGSIGGGGAAGGISTRSKRVSESNCEHTYIQAQAQAQGSDIQWTCFIKGFETQSIITAQRFA